MQSNTKILVIVSFLVITLGFGFLWVGFNPQQANVSPQATTSAPIEPGPATKGVEGERFQVTKVVDGDTIQINTGQTVRLIGIDTPETVDPRRPVGCFGKEASNELKNLTLGKEVILQKDVSDTDKYNRLLRLVFLPLDNGPASQGEQTLFVNDYLVREGFAKVYTYPPDVKYNEQFLEAEREARELKKGLWGRC